MERKRGRERESRSSPGLPQPSWLYELVNSFGIYLLFEARRVLTNGRMKKGREEGMEGGISAIVIIKNSEEAEI